jgi:4-hydroxyphenylacetate 3-monooxygenase
MTVNDNKITLPLGNGVRNGEQYLEGLRDDREVWLQGERVKDVTQHPGLCRSAKTLASFMDRQSDPEYQDIVTFKENGKRIATSFLVPKSKEDVIRRGEAFYEWAKWSNGMLGRTPDYKNASITAFYGGASLLEESSKEYAQNMRNYYHYASTNDKVLTHSLLNPTVNFELSKEGKSDKNVSLKVVKENDAGIFVTGARLLATLGPQADEVEVFPTTLLNRPKDEDYDFALSFTIPVNSPGLRMICRDSYDHQKSHYDAPLSSRYEEMDAVITFNEVFVPWERVFIYRDPDFCNRIFIETNALTQMMHQVVCGKLAKAEFIVGLLCAMARASGKDKDMAIKGQIAEAMFIAETVRALRFSAEQHAHEDEYGNYIPMRRPLDTSRNLFPKMYPRLIELVQLLGSSSLMATPSELDLSNEISGDVSQYFQLQNLESKDRIALFRLAHDISVSGFGSRQTLYERFFFGPSAITSSVYFDLYNKDDMMDRVNELLSMA